MPEATDSSGTVPLLEHGNELRRMEEKLAVGPKSWIKLCFRGKGRTRSRDYWYRYTATIREATQELVKDLGH